MSTSNYDIIIVGAGLAGLATVLHLARCHPELAARTLILEAAAHPRRKICGGAVTCHGEEQLASLGVQIDVPMAQVDCLQFRFGRHMFALEQPQVMRVVQRELFDAGLAMAAQRRQLTIHSHEPLVDLRPVPAGIEVTTSHSTYRARVVVGADGANSVVRRKLGLRGPHGIARLLRTLTPADPQVQPASARHTATFDFSCMRAGIQGYVWDFPCVIAGQAFCNRGIFDSRIAPRARGDLKGTFAAYLDARQVTLADVQLEGHPVRWFDPHAQFAQPHVLLVGDAAGVDPLFAEGISYALEYGAVAASVIGAAFEHREWSFGDYHARILRHPLGRALSFKATVARWLYGCRRAQVQRLFWWLAAIAPAWMQRSVGRSLGVLPAA